MGSNARKERNVCVKLSEAVVSAIDRQAAAEGLTRSAVIRRVLLVACRKDGGR